MDILRHLFFENPLPLWIALGIAALGAGVFWTRTGSRRAKWIAIAMVDTAIVLGLVAWLVETDYEKVARTLSTMSRAAEAGDADTFIERISAQYSDDGCDKDQIASVVRLGLSQLRVSTEPPGVRMAGDRAVVTQVYKFSPASAPGVAVSQDLGRWTWEGIFAPDADGEWRLRSAMATSPQRISPQAAARMLPRMRR
jgi:hypothetical protein